MRDFIESLFDGKKRIEFQYMNYNMAFYAGEYQDFYLIFFLESQEEMMELWERVDEVFQTIKGNSDIYRTNIDKNTLCLYCLKVSDEEYYQAETAGAMDGLSKKISMIEEDLDYFAKHVLIYTEKMDEFSQKNVGKFEELCRKYIVEGQFERYKNSSRECCEYDFLLNLFIKLPFLRFGQYQTGTAKGYHTLMSFIQESAKKHLVDLDKIQTDVTELGKLVEDENAFYSWLDGLEVNEENPQSQKEEDR